MAVCGIPRVVSRLAVFRGNDAVPVSLKYVVGHLSSWDGCKKELERKLSKFSVAVAAVILGCLSALKGPDVLRYWYVMERALFMILLLGMRTSFWPPCLSPFLLKIHLDIFPVVSEISFTELAVEFIHLGNIYWVITVSARHCFLQSQSRIRQKSAFKKFLPRRGRELRGRKVLTDEYTGFWGNAKEGTSNSGGAWGGLLQVDTGGEGFQMAGIKYTFFLLLLRRPSTCRKVERGHDMWSMV